MTKQRTSSLVLAALLLVLAAGIGGCRLVEKRAEVEVRAAERIGILCATEGGNCVESWNGSDILVYSDRGSTQKFHVDGATGNIDGEGTLAIAGNTDLEGTLSIDGQANAEQLVVQGYSTQSSSLFVLEDSDADEVVTVSGYGNVVISGTTTMTDALTVNNQIMHTGTANEEQFRIKGYSGQTANLIAADDNDGDQVFTLGPAGNVMISGTLAITGTISDPDTAVTVADNFLVDGQADAEQLVVQGNAVQGESLVVFEDSDADEVFTVSAYGNVVISGTVTLTETLTVNNNVSIVAAADEEHLVVQAEAGQTSSMFVLEDADADEVLTVSGVGNTVISGTLATSSTVTAGTWQVFTPQAILDVTSNEYTITCLGTYCRLTSSANRYIDDITCNQPEGTLLILTNVGENTITITDTATLTLTGNAALGEDSTLTLVSDSLGWIEIAVGVN